MQTASIARALKRTPPPASAPDLIVSRAAVAGCTACNNSGASCGACGCGSSPPGKVPPCDRGPMQVNAFKGNKYHEPSSPAEYEGESFAHTDPQYMTRVVGTALIAAGATATIRIEPTMGCFDGFYISIVSVDNAAPNNRGRVLVARFFVGDCPGDCRTTPIWSDVYDGTGENGCCTGVPFRTKFGRSNNGEELRVDITNPAGGFATANVHVIVTGVCHRGSCAC